MSKVIDKNLATLILRTASADNVSTYKTSMTWNNLNLQTLLGTMWDVYDYFNITLVEVGTAVANANLGDALDQCNVAFVLTGLPFINTRYYIQRQTILNQSIIGFLNYNRGVATNQIYYGNNVSTFNKSASIVNLSINYMTVSAETSPTSLNAFPETTFIFKICGIPKENIGEIDTSRRMKFLK
jgi:hypothetical protein